MKNIKKGQSIKQCPCVIYHNNRIYKLLTTTVIINTVQRYEK